MCLKLSWFTYHISANKSYYFYFSPHLQVTIWNIERNFKFSKIKKKSCHINQNNLTFTNHLSFDCYNSYVKAITTSYHLSSITAEVRRTVFLTSVWSSCHYIHAFTSVYSTTVPRAWRTESTTNVQSQSTLRGSLHV